ncbi:MAG: helix-turn-helix transcriptional regulator [Christensenellales bacterium]
MSNTKLKPLYLMDIFRELTDEEHRLTVPDLVEELQRRGVRAERKGIYRDIDALIEYGADIRKTGAGYYLSGREFTHSELRAVALAIKSAEFLSERRTAELTGKIGAFGGAYMGKKLIRGGMAARKSPNDETLNAIDMLDRAVAARRQVTFSYERTREATPRRYRVSPYGLMFIKGICCLACNIEGREDLSCIPVHRMRQLRTDMSPWRHFSEVSEYRGEFLLEDFAAKAIKNEIWEDVLC